MARTEQRAFAAVHENGEIDICSISVDEVTAEHFSGISFPGRWPEAKRRGWRIRPVVIRVEDENEGATTHDR